MASMKQIINIYPFAYHKILGGQRKIDIRPYSKRLHDLHVGDMVEYTNIETQESVAKEVKGIALFQNFETLINMLPPEMIGYHSREEVRLRIERMYSRREEREYGVCALFIGEPDVRRMMKLNNLERSA